MTSDRRQYVAASADLTRWTADSGLTSAVGNSEGYQ